MKNVKFLLLAIVMVFASMIIATPMQVSASEDLGQTIVFVQVPADWEAPGVWAWGSMAGGLWDHLGWPGQPMMEDPNNPGWYFQWLASDMTGGLVVDVLGDGGQTADFDLTGEPVWVTVAAGGAFEITNTPQTTGDFPSATTPIFAQVPEGWDAPRVWAWGGAPSAYFAAWPGTARMIPVPGNEGWFLFHAPGDMTGGLISANEGEIQTGDITLVPGQPTWITISGPGDDFTATDTPQTTGAIPQMYTIVYVQVPADWEAPGVWAWGSVTGGLWDHLGWPGYPMQECPNNPGWFFQYVPTDMTGGLVNANDGSIQTGDITLPGQPVWITVTGPGDGFTLTTTPQTTGAFAPFVPRVFAQDMIEVDAVVVYAYPPEEWEGLGFWGWGGDWNLFYEGEWPGPFPSPDPDNPGWYYIFVPASVTNIMFNEGYDGGRQTEGISFDGVPVWVTITSADGDFEVTTDAQTTGPVRTSDPFAFGVPEEVYRPDVDYIAIRAYVPPEWHAPALWAWHDGAEDEAGLGDMFIGWPGPQFTEMDGNWHIMHIPGWVDHIIINNSGQPQTDDIPITAGRDVWVVIINEFGQFEIRYEEFDPADAEAEARPEPVVFAPPTPAATPTPVQAAAPADDDGGVNLVLVIVIVSAVVAVLLAGAFLLLKKKK
ncbi:MAG: starch-binding protein [Defluviitaleaceae bacterium]|nr:starch-binding protein [Defluviitaleaceae bacterium]MCL2238474.1 starch-binding protein [Defluviitaleaceae bacterium]